jgi:hypothetical protein
MWLFFYSYWMLALHFFQVKIWRNQWLWARYSSSQIVPFERTLCTWAGWTFFHSYYHKLIQVGLGHLWFLQVHWNSTSFA